MKRSLIFILAAAVAAGACSDQQDPSSSVPELASTSGTTRINVLLKAAPTAANRAELAKHGNIYDEIAQINVLLMKTKAEKSQQSGLALRTGRERGRGTRCGANTRDRSRLEDFTGGHNVWNMDAINVTDIGCTDRKVNQMVKTSTWPSWTPVFCPRGGRISPRSGLLQSTRSRSAAVARTMAGKCPSSPTSGSGRRFPRYARSQHRAGLPVPVGGERAAPSPVWHPRPRLFP